MVRLNDPKTILERMRDDWDRRAREDAERSIYTRDSSLDCPGFDDSGRANYNQLVRPYLPILLNGRPAGECVAVEIGCGVGRMTRWFAEAFGEVHAFDVSPVMVEEAWRRLAGYRNVKLYAGSGADLKPLADESADLVFSYIVFQHVPSKAVVENYVLEAARVLTSGGALKIQVNGAGATPESPDTWLGVTYQVDEAVAMLRRAGFSMLSVEGAGTQYLVLTACKGEPWPLTYLLPGEPWAGEYLIDGWHAAVDGSWRPVDSWFSARLPGTGTRFFAGIYFWPDASFQAHTVTVEIGGRRIGEAAIAEPGDHYVEFDAKGRGVVRVSIDPPCARNPALRVIGFY